METQGDGTPDRDFVHPETEEEAENLVMGPEIHDYFGLSYANYLVLNRTVLQSMPEQWQKDFVQMLAELNKEVGYAMALHPSIMVRILKREPERLYDEWDKCESCKGTGEDDSEFGIDGVCAECDGAGKVEVESDRFEEPEDVGYMEDPVPHYSRGRTRIPLASQSVEEVLPNNNYYQLIGAWMKTNYPDEWHKVFGPQFESGEKVEVARFTHGHALPPIMEEIKGLGFFEGRVVNIVPGSDNLLYRVMVQLGDPNASLAEPYEIEVQLHVDQIHSPR